MVQMAGRVLKSNNVNIEGKYHLGMTQTNNDCLSDMSSAKKPQAKIIESDGQGIVIQITCSCGQTICLRGDYSKS